MRELTLEEWKEEGRRKYGKLENWKWKCPACGHVSSAQDFKDLQLSPDDAYCSCIGRFNGKGADGLQGKDKGHGCNWASYGFFRTLGKGLCVVTSDGKKTEIFEFAD